MCRIAAVIRWNCKVRICDLSNLSYLLLLWHEGVEKSKRVTRLKCVRDKGGDLGRVNDKEKHRTSVTARLGSKQGWIHLHPLAFVTWRRRDSESCEPHHCHFHLLPIMPFSWVFRHCENVRGSQSKPKAGSWLTVGRSKLVSLLPVISVDVY